MTKSPRKSCPGGENYMETGAGRGRIGGEGGRVERRGAGKIGNLSWKCHGKNNTLRISDFCLL